MRSRPPIHASSQRLSIRRVAIAGVIATLSQFLIAPTTAFAADLPISDEAETVKGNNAFAVELYGQLRSQPGNLFFSPESISTALAMTYAGARGQTATEMANVLHFTLPPERLHPAMAALLKDRNAAHDGYQLKEADALWGQQSYTFLPEFLKLTSDNYGAGLNHVDFKNATEAARVTINQWVEQQTEQKIKDLIAPGVLDERTRLVMTVAIYFKADWETRFNKEQTKDKEFHVSAAKTITAPLMHRTGEYNYFDGQSFQALEIPYKNKDLSMIVFLPKDADGLAAFEASMTAANIERWSSKLKPASEVIVIMPKFETDATFPLNAMLKAMGMQQAFDCKTADFSGLASKETIQRNGTLYLSAAIHTAYVEVNEEGTEAAAATATATNVPMGVILNVFRADHPFVFLIRDNMTGAILFMGRLTNPKV